MNITDLIPGQQVIAQTHEPNGPINEFPVRLLGIEPTEHGTYRALFVFYDAEEHVWRNLTVQSFTISGPWAITQTRTLFTVRAEQYITVTELAEQIAWDGVATDELVQRIIQLLGMDPAHADGDTLIGEDAAERVANEIAVTA